jgi:hypothetical protein
MATPRSVDFDYAAKLTSLNIAALWPAGRCAAIPGQCDDFRRGEPSTTLSWSAPDPAAGANLMGYRIYWRYTDAPQWTSSRYVGDVTSSRSRMCHRQLLFRRRLGGRGWLGKPGRLPWPCGIVWRLLTFRVRGAPFGRAPTSIPPGQSPLRSDTAPAPAPRFATGR